MTSPICKHLRHFCHLPPPPNKEIKREESIGEERREREKKEREGRSQKTQTKVKCLWL